jgi:hypothetical protein
VDIVSSPTFWGGNIATDIPQDFAILGTGTTVNIPAGAAYLFVVAHDSYYEDNSDPNHDFAVSIRLTTPVPEPETYAMMLAGLGLLGFAGRRRKQQIA